MSHYPKTNSSRVRTFAWLTVAAYFIFFINASNLLAGPIRVMVADEQIAELVRQLGADRFADRQAAMRKLIEYGHAAIEPLEQSIKGSEPEMRMRSMAVLQRLAVSRDLQTQSMAQQSIQRLADSDDADLKRLARQTMAQLADSLQETAIDELQKLGAQVEAINSTFDGIRYVTVYSVEVGADWKGSREDLKLFQWVRDVNSLTLIGDQIDDESIQFVSSISRLNTLIIKRAKITNAAIKTFSEIKTLTILQLVYCPIDDSSVEEFQRLQQLVKLQLYGTKMSRDVATSLATKMNIEVDLRMGAFLGVYYDRASEPCEISRVVPGSSADKGGIKAGDIILSFNDHPIKSGNDFQGAVSDFQAGQKVVVVVERNDEQLELEIELGQFMDEETLR